MHAVPPSTPVPCSPRSHGGDAPRPPQSPDLPSPSDVFSFLLEALDTTAFSSGLFGPLWSDAQTPPMPQAPMPGPSTQQVLNTGLGLQGRLTHSPAQGCSSWGAQLQLFSTKGKPSLVGRGLDQCVCVHEWSQSSSCRRSAEGKGNPRRALSPPYPDRGGWFLGMKLSPEHP